MIMIASDKPAIKKKLESEKSLLSTLILLNKSFRYIQIWTQAKPFYKKYIAGL